MIAPERGLRPGAGRGRIPEPTEEELETCPFCAGRVDRTPPETLRLGDPWRVRVVPNLYPAFERQEIVVHSPEHKRSFADLDDEEIELVAEAWSRRRAAHPEGYLHACVNEGRDAGASLPHSHSQLVWLPEEPPAVAAESGDGPRVEDGYEVERSNGLVALCPAAGRAPYELLVVPERPTGAAFEPPDLAAALTLLRSLVRRLRAVEGAIPWNAWLHARRDEWHLELVPRLTVFAAVELGAGIYVNPLDPEEAARTLRGV